MASTSVHAEEPLLGATTLAPPRLEYKSNSEPELRGRSGHRAGSTGFPPGVTVDELIHYRRRRPPSHLRPRDNLHPEQGSLKFIKSEYRRRFLSYPFHDKENIRVHRRRVRPPGDAVNFGTEVFLKAEYSESFVEFPRQRPATNRRPRTILGPSKDVPMETTTEKSSHYVEFSPAKQRPPLARKPTTLKYEGDMLVTQSELRAKFIAYEGARRAELTRRPTTLKMEGEMDTMTEKREKYVGYVSPNRTPIMRQRANLRMEGEMATTTEKRDKYVAFPSPKRAESRRRPTNLRLEGEIETRTESNSKYVEYGPVKRPELLKRLTNLHLEGEVEYIPEYKSICVDYPRERPIVKRPASNLKPEGEFEKNTEIRSQFMDLSSHIRRPDVQRPSTNLRLEGNIESKPEYKDSFVNFPRERPKLKKQETNLKMEGDFEKMTEKNANFVEFPPTARSNINAMAVHADNDVTLFPVFGETFRDSPRRRQKKASSHKRPQDSIGASLGGGGGGGGGDSGGNEGVNGLPGGSEDSVLPQDAPEGDETSQDNVPPEPEYKSSMLDPEAVPKRPQQQTSRRKSGIKETEIQAAIKPHSILQHKRRSSKGNTEVYKAFQVLERERPEKVVTFDLIGPRPRTRR
ncbi:uncharacterized protein [Anabrus simplex]|uniref:uncharacterized protein n=1 Tax=Anabrus simplex TaxID=316456 RepID=UPI0035A27AEB